MAKDYRFIKALRPFSLAVALVACGVGVRLAWLDGYQSAWVALGIIAAGLLAQAGMNLINDLEDLPLLGTDHLAERRIIHINAWVGIAMIIGAALIGIVFIILRGWPLLLVFGLSAIAALSYNFGPFNFKQRGFALILVVILMGITMIPASYYVMSGQLGWLVFWLSLPISALIALLLLSNEIRDISHDRQHQMHTVSVRLGLDKARLLYWGLVLLAYLLALALALTGLIAPPYLLLLPLVLLPWLWRSLYSEQRQRLTPLTGRFFLLFGLAYLVGL